MKIYTEESAVIGRDKQTGLRLKDGFDLFVYDTKNLSPNEYAHYNPSFMFGIARNYSHLQDLMFAPVQIIWGSHMIKLDLAFTAEMYINNAVGVLNTIVAQSIIEVHFRLFGTYRLAAMGTFDQRDRSTKFGAIFTGPLSAYFLNVPAPKNPFDGLADTQAVWCAQDAMWEEDRAVKTQQLSHS